ncbi:MAG: PKD domain-containing protein [Chloroflexi bacterium]|nr:PKD domain-containing protein [Chloroflexota bacterium]
MRVRNTTSTAGSQAPRLLRWGIILALSLMAAAFTLALFYAQGMPPNRGTAHYAREAAALAPSAHVYTSTMANLTIPDNGCVNNQYATWDISVTDAFSVGRVRVGLNVNHTGREDLRVQLSASSNVSTWLLFDTSYVTHSQNLDVMFDDRAQQAPDGDGGDHDTFPPYYDHTWKPYAPLAAFDGISSTVTWTLRICDKSAGWTGNLAFFSLWLDEQTPDFAYSAKLLDKTLFGPGESVTYTVVVTNSGWRKAYAASVLDKLPAGLTLDPDGLSTSYGQLQSDDHDRVVTWTGTLLPEAGTLITIPASISTCVAPLINTAIITDPDMPASMSVTVSSQEGFESLSVALMPTITLSPIFPPADWGTGTVTGTSGDWSRSTLGNHPTIAPHQGESMAQFNAYTAASGDSARLYTRILNFPSDYSPHLTFWMYHETTNTALDARTDRIQVQVSDDDGETWEIAPGATFTRSSAMIPTGWVQHSVDLSDYANNVRIGFLGISDAGNNIYIDDINIEYQPASGSFIYQPVSPMTGQPVTFTGHTLGATDAFTKTWDFGDGYQQQAGSVVTHTYATSGTYPATMTVCGHVVTQSIFVSSEPVPVELSLQSSSPAPANSPTYFTATLNKGTLPIAYTWDFGDGNVQTGSSITNHTYPAAGQYTATLTGVNDAGTAAFTLPVTINAVADLGVILSASHNPATINKPITFTLVLSNTGPDSAPGVLLTATLPSSSKVSVATVAKSQGNCGYIPATAMVTCTLGLVDANKTAIVTLGLKASTTGTYTISAQGTTTVFDPATTNNTASMAFTAQQSKYYLPVVARHYPLIPSAPVLNAIANSYGNGHYTVSWNAVTLATLYTLQEANNSAFANAVTVFTGTATQWQATAKLIGTYYYRVKAAIDSNEGSWSNVQSTTVLRQFDGYWAGTTSQNKSISFMVSNSAIASLNFTYTIAGCDSATQPYLGVPVLLNGNAFTVTQSGANYTFIVTGTFNSSTSATGGLIRWSYSDYPVCYGSAVATWSAVKK